MAVIQCLVVFFDRLVDRIKLCGIGLECRDKIIRDVFDTLVNKGSCLVAKPAIDTIKIAKDGRVETTIDRNTVWMAQTPQAASIALLKKLYGRIAAEPLNFTPTDEASTVVSERGDILSPK